ncbi:uncharacterized protein ISCGN_005248 [Ixodes scapularis]
MLSKISITLMVLCSLFFVNPCYASTEGNPTKDFYDDMQSRPILTYECYNNGSSINPANSVNLTIIWDGTSPNTTQAYGVIWSATKGTKDSYTTQLLQTYYDTARGVAVFSTDTVTEDITVGSKFEGKELFLKINVHGGDTVYKIYDVDFQCTNAKAFLPEACPSGCGLQLSREVSDE